MPRILVVDDETAIRSLLAMAFARAGYEVRTAGRAREALALCAVEAFDALLSDVLMPEMNGLEVQRRLQRVSPSTRVIVLTAKDDPSVRRMAMNAGASAFFIKGVESSEFLAGVKATADSLN